jgi:DNA-binding IclR family transcriptional regulator
VITDEKPAKPDAIPTVMRLLLVVEEVARLGVAVTPTEINQRLGLPKPTIHRLFATLEEEGFLQKNLDGRSYTPGPRLRSLAAGVLSSRRQRGARLAVMTAMAGDIGETCNLVMPDQDEMIFLERVETKWPLRIRLPVSTRVPFHCTACGKLYLSSLSDAQLEAYLERAKLDRHTPTTITDPDELRAEIETVRRAGYAQDNEEFMLGMVALAVPIRDQRGRLLSTISFHAPVQRMDVKTAHAHLPRLRQGADELTRLVMEDS